MPDNQRRLILRLIELTSKDVIFWHNKNDATMKNHFNAYYEGYYFRTLSLPDESPKLFVKFDAVEIMIIDNVPCSICDLICSIHSQFRREGVSDIEEDAIHKMNVIVDRVLHDISS